MGNTACASWCRRGGNGKMAPEIEKPLTGTYKVNGHVQKSSLRDRIAASLDRRFEVSARGSTLFVEARGGFIMWMTMSYIMVVNPVILGKAQTDDDHLPAASLMSATAAASVVGSLLAGLWANLPLGLMPGMGLNAYFVFGICKTFDVSLQEGLSCGFASGALLLLLAQLGVCNWLVKIVLSDYLKSAITVSIGLFQAMIGFQIMGLVVASPDTLVTIGDLSLSNTKFYVSLVGFCLVAILSCQQVHGALLIGIWQIAICSWIMGIGAPPDSVFLMPSFDLALAIDFSGWYPGSGKLGGMIVGSLVLFFVALFDIAGVQYGLISLAGLLKNKAVPRSTEIFSAAALSTMFGSLVGTSPLIIANESSAGIMEGAKTGLSSIVVAALFLLSAFISPVLSSIPHIATAAPLVLIGAFMMGPVKAIDWDNLNVALPSFMTVTVVPFTYSIHGGIIAGLLMDLILNIVTHLRRCCDGIKDPYEEQAAKFHTPTQANGPPKRASGRSTPGAMTPDHRLCSPHTAVGRVAPTEMWKEEKVEQLLSDFVKFSQGVQLETKDEILLTALQAYLSRGDASPLDSL